jgi:hypothetical protein
MEDKMIILAIDPGPEKSAWVVYHPESLNPIWESGIEENDALIQRFIDGREPICYMDYGDYEIVVDEVVIEMVASYGMAVGASVFETCVTIGRFVQLFTRLPVNMMYRKDVKMHLCHSMRAKDANIRQAIIDRLGPPGTKKHPGKTFGVKADIWAALACAVTFADTRPKGEADGR